MRSDTYFFPDLGDDDEQARPVKQPWQQGDYPQHLLDGFGDSRLGVRVSHPRSQHLQLFQWTTFRFNRQQ